MENRALIIGGIAVVAAIVGAIISLFFNFDAGDAEKRFGEGARSALESSKSGKARGSVERPENEVDSSKGLPPGMAFAAAAMRALLEEMLKDPNALRNEVILRFTDDEAFADFLARARAEGVKLISTLDGLLAVRLKFENGQALHNELAQLDGDSVSLEPNFIYTTPSFNSPDGSTTGGIQEGAQPVGYDFREIIGLHADNSNYGAGVTIAIIDSGVTSHPTFREGQITQFDLVGGDLTQAAYEHGMAVTSVAVGNDPTAPGVAPGAEVISIRVLDENGETNSFLMAEALQIAIQNDADIANMSIGSRSESDLLGQVIDDATASGMVIVAPSGNDGSGQVMFPASHPSTVAVGAVDGSLQHMAFSTTGEELTIAAPGYRLPAAGVEGNVIGFTGTSGAAPVITGGIASVMSEYGVNSSTAAQIVVDLSAEAHAPGYDTHTGSGAVDLTTLAWGDDPSVTDARIAGQVVEGEVLKVTAENGGNSTLFDVSVDTSVDGQSVQSSAPFIEPGETATFEISLDLSAVEDPARVEVTSTVGFGGSTGSEDVVPRNDTMTTTFSN
ncbi:MAG: S8 family serine peptidase [Verrucomicrobiota bacterium]